MTIKFVESKRTLSAVSLLAAFILIASAVAPAQETWTGSAGVPQKTITAVITWHKDFATTPAESNAQQPAANPCWPFSMSVNSAPGTSAVFASTSTESRYKLKDDMHVCTFDLTGPAGVPLVIEPGVRRIGWLNAKELPPPIPIGNGSKFSFRYTRGFTPARKPWTLGAKGVYLSFTFGLALVSQSKYFP